MMRCLVLLAALSVAALCAAQDITKKVEDLVSRLQSDDWKVRKEAEKQLVSLGEAALEPIRAIKTKTFDPNMAVKLARVLRGIREKMKADFFRAHPDIESLLKGGPFERERAIKLLAADGSAAAFLILLNMQAETRDINAQRVIDRLIHKVAWKHMKLLLDIANDNQEEEKIRARAIVMLASKGYVIDPRYLYSVLTGQQKASKLMECAALVGLSRYAGRSMLPFILEWLKSGDEWKQATAVLAASFAGQYTFRKAFRFAVKHKIYRVYPLFVDYATNVGMAGELAGEFARIVTDPEVPEMAREDMVKFAGAQGIPEYRPVLEAVLKPRKDTTLAQLASWWFSVYPVRECADMYARYLDHPVKYVRANCALALCKLFDDRYAPKIAEALAKESDSEARSFQIDALMALYYRDGLKALAKCLTDRDAKIRWKSAAAIALLASGFEVELIHKLARLLEDENEKVRGWALVALTCFACVKVPPDMMHAWKFIDKAGPGLKKWLKAVDEYKERLGRMANSELAEWCYRKHLWRAALKHARAALKEKPDSPDLKKISQEAVAHIIAMRRSWTTPPTTGLVLEEGKLFVYVAFVPGFSPARRAGVQPYDQIIEIDGRPVRTLDDFVKVLCRKRPCDIVELKLRRLKKVFTVKFPLLHGIWTVPMEIQK